MIKIIEIGNVSFICFSKKRNITDCLIQ